MEIFTVFLINHTACTFVSWVEFLATFKRNILYNRPLDANILRTLQTYLQRLSELSGHWWFSTNPYTRLHRSNTALRVRTSLQMEWGGSSKCRRDRRLSGLIPLLTTTELRMGFSRRAWKWKIMEEGRWVLLYNTVRSRDTLWHDNFAQQCVLHILRTGQGKLSRAYPSFGRLNNYSVSEFMDE